MSHTRANDRSRQSALDELYQAITEMDAAVTDAESREQRMSSREDLGRAQLAERFPAFQNGAPR